MVGTGTRICFSNVAKADGFRASFPCPAFGHPADRLNAREPAEAPFRLPAPSKKTPQKPDALWRCAPLLHPLPLIGQQGGKLAVLFPPLLLGLIQPVPQVLDLVRQRPPLPVVLSVDAGQTFA